MAKISDTIHIFRPAGADPENSEMGDKDTCHMDITYFTENSLKIVLGNFTDQRGEWRGPLDQLQNPSQCNFIFIPCIVIQDSLGLWIPRALWIPDSTTVFYIYCP